MAVLPYTGPPLRPSLVVALARGDFAGVPVAVVAHGLGTVTDAAVVGEAYKPGVVVVFVA